MLGPIPATRLKMVESIARLTASLSPRRSQGLALDFARAYFRGVADDDLAALEPSSLAAMALHHLAFGAQRRGRQPLVRVFNPEPTRDGVRTPHTVAMVVCDDMPFLVDSVSMAANHSGLAVRLIIHPVLPVRRAAGALIGIEDGTGPRKESWQWLEIDRIENPARLADLERRIRTSLEDVRSAVEDWQQMTDRALTLANARLAGEEISFELTDPATQTRYVCSGRIVGHNISGSIQVASANAQRQLGWDAARTELGTPAHALLKQPTMQELQEKMQP